MFVFFPGNLIVFVPIIILPDFGNVIIDVSFLHSFDPGFQLLSGNKAVPITVNPINNLPAVKKKANTKPASLFSRLNMILIQKKIKQHRI